MAITIHGICVSPFVRKVLIVADALGLEYDNISFSPMKLPENYRAISPLGKIPALTDDETNLCDSTVICDYLNNKYGPCALYPTDPALRAKALWLQEYAGSKLLETLAGLFFERIVKPKYRKEATDQARIDNILTNLLPPALDYLESILPESGFILGEMTIADIAIGSQFVNARYAQYQVDSEKWPKLSTYVAMLLSQPCFVKHMTKDAQLFSQ